MTNEHDGGLARPGLPTSVITLPDEVWLEGEGLGYRMPGIGEGYVLIDPRGMLDAFVAIKDGPDIMRFAHRYGVLNLCSHHLPWSHTFSDHAWREMWNTWDPCEYPVRPESIADWLSWVDCTRALLNCAAALHEDRLPPLEEWEKIDRLMSPNETLEGLERMRAQPDGLEIERLLLGDFVWTWLEMGDVKPKFSWDTDGPKFFLNAGTFGVLGVQLMQAIARAGGLATCTGCGMPYMREGRKPQAGRRNYCPSCGTRAALRDAQRERRARLKEAQDGKAKG